MRAARSSTSTAGTTTFANLYVCDGSLFPTSIGANPQLSIYAFAARIARSALARRNVL